jgi:hypothetical protein
VDYIFFNVKKQRVFDSNYSLIELKNSKINGFKSDFKFYSMVKNHAIACILSSGLFFASFCF